MATVIAFVMLTWGKGQQLVKARRYKLERPLAEFLDQAHSGDLHRVPGTAVFLHTSDDTTPLSLRENIDFNNVLHQRRHHHQQHPDERPPRPRRGAGQHRQPRRPVGRHLPGPAPLRLRRRTGHPRRPRPGRPGPGLSFDPDTALYFLSRVSVHASPRPGMTRWRKRVYIAMSHNGADPTQYFHLPIERTVVVGAQLF